MITTIKKLCVIIGSVTALAACSQDNLPVNTDTESRMIAFSTSFSTIESRAEVVTKENLPYFRVTAFDMADNSKVAGGILTPLFADEKVVVTPGKPLSTSPYCVWPDKGKGGHTVSFFGFYPGVDKLGDAQFVNHSSTTTIDYKIDHLKVAHDIADQVDFITSYTTGSMDKNLNTGIKLPFFHQFSRIDVKIHGAFKSGDLEIAGVRIGGAGVEGTFAFSPNEKGGAWVNNPTRGIVEHIYGEGDQILTCGRTHPIDAKDAISIMGTVRSGGAPNYAMLIPSGYGSWDQTNDNRNVNKGLYISTLLRVIDRTSTEAHGSQQYPYLGNSNIPDSLKVFFAVDSSSNRIIKRLYKNGNNYFTDAEFQNIYSMGDGQEVKTFGWAALPVAGNWSPGLAYTYTLDYTFGVGLHDPELPTANPKAGDPIFSDKVSINVTVNDWTHADDRPFEVPGS